METLTVKVRNIEFGKGRPKICVPIVEKTKEDILNQAKLILDVHPDCVELRIDYYEDVMDKMEVFDLLEKLRIILGDIVILFTFRTNNEGGNTPITIDDYKKLCINACKSGFIDLLDVEAYLQKDLLATLCKKAHKHGVFVVASNHDFKETPTENEIIRRLKFMDEQGADIPKIAVMPKDQRDVLTLLSATLRYYELGYIKPLITISMSGVGCVSRLIGELVGAVATFVTVGKASAPGQIPMEEVEHILKVVHTYK